MFYELIATFVAGLGTAGVALLATRLSGGRLPRWTVPSAAGLAMIAFTIWSESTWASRTIAKLPESIVEVKTIRQSVAWKPWTYIRPEAVRFMAVDTATRRENPKAPGTQLVDLYLFARWTPVVRVPQLIDCTTQSRADVTDAALADPAQADWTPLSSTPALLSALCQG